jgi:hypothetical protein
MHRTLCLAVALLITLVTLLPRAVHAAWPHDPATGVPICVRAGEQQDNPVTVSDGAGGAIVIWRDYRTGPTNVDLYAQRISAGGEVLWEAGGYGAMTAGVSPTGVAAIPDGAGGVIFCWYDFRHSNWDIFAQRLTAAGTRVWFGTGLSICTATGTQSIPRLAPDGQGGAIIAWTDSRNGNPDIYAQRVSSAGATLWRANGAPVCSLTTTTQQQADIASDGLGGAYVVWSDNRVGNYDVYAQHLTSTGAYDWTLNGEYLCQAIGTQENPRVIADGHHDAIVAWEDARSGSKGIYAQKSLISNYRPWTDNGVLLASQGTTPRVVPTGGEGAIVAWSGGTDVWAQMLGAGGSPQWTSGGVALGSAANGQTLTDLVPDGLGGAIAAWDDGRTGPFEDDVYAQRVSGSGIVQWPTNGIRAGGGPTAQLRGTLAADGAGGAVVAYFEQQYEPTGLGDIVAQSIERFGRLGEPQPFLTRVRDVPNDQGGSVQVEWTASYLDAYPGMSVSRYSIWRQVPDAASPLFAALSRAAGTSLRAPDGRVLRAGALGTRAVYWELLATQSAHGLPGYSYVAATTSDSLAGSNPYTRFMVSAEEIDGPAFWDSAPDSGYSVDNLAPPTPAPFTGAFSGASAYLQWGASPASDFVAFRLYRGTTPGFVPGAGNLVATTPSGGYVDASPQLYYKLCAVDAHGNASPYASLYLAGAVDVATTSVPRELFLAAPAPNPARAGATLLRFGLPRATRVSLVVHDAQGRTVRTLLAGALPAGEHEARWDGTDDAGRALPAGLYLVRLEAADRALTRRLALVR